MKQHLGFSLIELMISIAILGILSSAAFPMYTDYIQRSRRSDGISALLKLQLAQEKWRATNISYTSTIGTGGLALNASSEQGFYNLAITGASSTAFTMTATATGTQAKDTSCATLTVTQNGPDTAGTNADCWNR